MTGPQSRIIPVVTTRDELRPQIEARLDVLSDAELADLARQLDAPPAGRQLDSSDVAVRVRREQQAAQAHAAQDAMRPSLAWALAHPLHAPVLA
jgi:hypothetical protein